MKGNLAKWLKTIEITFSKHTAYKLNFVLLVLAPFLVFFFIKFNLWSALYEGNNTPEINGYDLKEMIQYHLWILIIGLIGTGHISFDLASDIRLGRISSYLIYPFNFWEFHTASFVSFQFLQIIISGITLLLVSSFGLVDLPPLEVFLIGVPYIIFVSLFWFSMQFLTGILGFWLEQTWMLRVLFSITVGFLSGAVIPLDFFPDYLIDLIEYSPFPYMNFYPTKIFMGEEVNLLKGFLIISFWLVIVNLIIRWVWNKGIRMYTGAGI